jgi:alpha,alpha-trehalase
LPSAAADPKFAPAEGNRWPVYVSAREDLAGIERRLRALLPPPDFARLALRRLPDSAAAEMEPGLLYLPRPYVVPGGRFNEMYGWDSYFIQVGLLRDAETALARDMVDNFIYQVEHYGKILNANRSYYLTRSQPPFLTRMILGVYRRQPDRAWLRGTVPAIESYYRYWTEGEHTLSETGLARYYDAGEGPAPEVVSSERDREGRTHYDRVKEYYRTHEVGDYDIARFYDRGRDELTPLFYKGDRSMRESGFDPSNRFGPFSVAIIDYNPVCLNSLLYVMERDAAEIMRILGRRGEARTWEARARQRAERINRLMWDERDGLYYDYDAAAGRVRRYPFVTTFYPLWAGLASRRQAARVVSNLGMFERAGGLRTSTNVSGSQWDAPYGWAPMQLIAIEGLRRYGYAKEADRISINFLSMVLKEFIEHHVMVEKYDVERRDSDVGAGLRFGYGSNEIGFGWTNAAFTELFAGLSPVGRQKVTELRGQHVPREVGRAW